MAVRRRQSLSEFLNDGWAVKGGVMMDVPRGIADFDGRDACAACGKSACDEHGLRLVEDVFPLCCFSDIRRQAWAWKAMRQEISPLTVVPAMTPFVRDDCLRQPPVLGILP
jgi:hypothetical protein